MSLEIQRKIKTPIVNTICGWEKGYRVQRSRARKRLRTGDIKKVEMFAIDGIACSFTNSFKASAIGWGRPIIATLFGPFRSWIYPRIFRSRRVKNAIARRAIRKIKMQERRGDNINPKKS